MTVPLVVMDHTISITCEEELVIFRELDASDSCAMVVQRMDGSIRPAIKLENSHLIVKISAYIEEHKVLSALIAEICEQVV